ncbi:homogentisate 1,2-dioxygenase [candidate division GN15 bacterium]|nr:homogentisate 1,2-dioxygenase [candidate division GN15 bacterium]
MPFYHRLGHIPRKPHTTHYKQDGKSLYREELFSTLGFSGVFSNKYHINMPSKLLRRKLIDMPDSAEWPNAPLVYTHFFTDNIAVAGDFIWSRRRCLFNDTCVISISAPTENTDRFFRNQFDEYIYVHFGEGVMESDYGRIPFVPGDQLIIPKGTTYRLEFKQTEGNKLLICESATAYDIPSKYRNEYGQFVEGAPICERDIKLPEYLEPRDESGEFVIILKARGQLHELTVPHHPFDVVGWDGYNYPWAVNIHDFCPIVGKIHQPPPVHLLLQTQTFVLCNFTPRLFDFHPDSIPAPYFHSNIDSDEVLYYAEGNFMSRKGIKQGSITLHPSGMPHGPQPGKTEASIGAKETNEYAIMIDTFQPLTLTLPVKESLDESYPQSWLKE